MKPEDVNRILRQTHSIYNTIADDFSNTRNKWWLGLEKIADLLPNGGKVLDVGCGNGRLVEIFKDKDAEYLGVDNSEELIKIAQSKYCSNSHSVILANAGIQKSESSLRQKMDSLLQGNDRNKNTPGKISFAVDDITNLKTTGEFDLIIMIAVLHHLPTEGLRLKALKSIHELLKPNGKFVMYNWHLWSWQYRHRYWKNLLNFKEKKLAGLSSWFDALIPWKPLNENDKRYVHSFTKRELRKLLTKAGFKTEDIYYDTRGKKANFIWGYNTVVIASKK